MPLSGFDALQTYERERDCYLPVRDAIGWSDRDSFKSAFIGALAALCPEELWRKAIDYAHENMVSKYGKITP
jgi:hypothetical protein